MKAYDAFLIGRHALNKRVPDQLSRAIASFQAAIAEDPGYAAAHAGLADAYTLSAIGYGAAPRDALPRAKAAALQALTLDDTLADAHTSLGYVALHYDWDFFAAERAFRRARVRTESGRVSRAARRALGTAPGRSAGAHGAS